jgi:hypothetical protein
MAVYAESEDLINVGAYHAGSNPAIDEAIAKHQSIEEFLIQAVGEHSSEGETYAAMEKISGVPIPVEEMSDSPPKVEEKIPLPPAGAETHAQNSVAALFAGRGLPNIGAGINAGDDSAR